MTQGSGDDEPFSIAADTGSESIVWDRSIVRLHDHPSPARDAIASTTVAKMAAGVRDQSD